MLPRLFLLWTDQSSEEQHLALDNQLATGKFFNGTRRSSGMGTRAADGADGVIAKLQQEVDSEVIGVALVMPDDITAELRRRQYKAPNDVPVMFLNEQKTLEPL
jgi:hypothetical protein